MNLSRTQERSEARNRTELQQVRAEAGVRSGAEATGREEGKWAGGSGYRHGEGSPCLAPRPLGILHVVTGLAQGGAERQLFLLLEGLDRSRFFPTVLVRHATKSDYWTAAIRRLGVEVRELPGHWPAPRRYFEIYRELRRLKPDIVQGWTLWTNPQLAVLGRLAGVPARVGSLRCNLYRAGRGSLERLLTTRGLDRIVTNSTRGRHDLLGLGVAGNKVEVVFNAVQVDARLEGLDRAAVRRAMGSGPGDVVLASIGNLTWPKNYPLLINAVRELRAAGFPVKCVVYGEGPDRGKLEGEVLSANLSDHVHLCGQQPDARVLVAAADIFVLTSFGEGMANALLEGAAAGLPLVATAVGGATDIILHGETGFVVPVDDRQGLVATLQRLIDDPEGRAEMGRQARRRVLQEFSQARMVERFQELYTRVAVEKRPRVRRR